MEVLPDATKKEQFLARVPEQGTPIGNTVLRAKLGWDEVSYEAVKGALINEGILKAGPGYGGSVRRLTGDPAGERAFQSKMKQFQRRMPQDGSTIGNKRLRQQLNWDIATYQQVKERLVADGIIVVGRGYGGTVSLVTEGKRAPERAPKSGPRARTPTKEKDLYPPFGRGLEAWAQDQGWHYHFVEKIAHQGKKRTGGTWTRPDFVVVGTRKYIYTPGVVRDVETFELKLANCGIAAVFETAAHSRFATKSYLAIKKENTGPSEQDLARIESECQRFGIGLVLFDDPANVDTWEYRVEPDRGEPDPQHLEEFVRTQLPKRRQEEFQRML